MSAAAHRPIAGRYPVVEESVGTSTCVADGSVCETLNGLRMRRPRSSSAAVPALRRSGRFRSSKTSWCRSTCLREKPSRRREAERDVARADPSSAIRHPGVAVFPMLCPVHRCRVECGDTPTRMRRDTSVSSLDVRTGLPLRRSGRPRSRRLVPTRARRPPAGPNRWTGRTRRRRAYARRGPSRPRCAAAGGWWATRRRGNRE